MLKLHEFICPFPNLDIFVKLIRWNLDACYRYYTGLNVSYLSPKFYWGILLSYIYVVVIMYWYQMDYHFSISLIYKKTLFCYGYKTIDYMILIRLYIEYDCQSICCLLTVNIMLQQFYYCNYLDRLSRPLSLLP